MPRMLFVSLLPVLLSIFKAASNAATVEETADSTPRELESAIGVDNTPGCHEFTSSLLEYWPLDGYGDHDFYLSLDYQAPQCVVLLRDVSAHGYNLEESSCDYSDSEKALQLDGGHGDPAGRIKTDKFNFDESDSFTIMVRIKPKSLSGHQPLVVKGNRAWDYGIWLAGESLLTGSNGPENSQVWTNGSYKIEKGKWHHVAYVYDGGTSKMYVNGRDVGVTKTYRINTNGSGDGSINLGKRGEVKTHPKFKGLMADVAIFNKVVPPEDIAQIAVHGFCTRPRNFPASNTAYYPYIAPVSSEVKAMIRAKAQARDSATQILAAYFTVDGRDQVSMKPTDGSFDSISEYVHKVTLRPIKDAGLHEVCIWAVDTNDYKGDRECYMMPVYDQNEGYIVGSGSFDVKQEDFMDQRYFIDGYGRIAFVIKYKETQGYGDQAYKGELVFATAKAGAGGFLFHSTKIYKYKRANKETGEAFFQGTGTINGHPSPSGKDYRFKVWIKDSFSNEDEYLDQFRLQVYWTEPMRGMKVYEYDNELSREFSKFFGELRIEPGTTTKDE